MKSKLVFLMSFVALFLMQFSTLPLLAQSRDQATWVASEQNFSQGQTVANPFSIGDYVQCTLATGTGTAVPAYYSGAVRVYAKNTMTISPLNGASIQQIDFTCKKNGSKTYLPIASVTNIGAQSVGTLDDPTPATANDEVVATWTGESTKGLVFTMGNSGQRCILQIVVTYTSPSNTFYQVIYTANGGVGEDVVYSYAYNSTVTVMENPFDRDEFVFSHWNTAADGSGTTYNPTETFTISEDVTLYAQWTTSIHLFVDVFNPTNVNEAIGDTTGYINWELNLPNNESPRVTYKGKSLKNNFYLQMNSSISGTSSYSGIVTTHTNNMKAKKVKVTWNGMTDVGRTLDIYGRNTPYSGTPDLYGETQGTFLGSIVNGTSTELDIEALAGSLGSFPYLGIRSNSGAVYLSEIRIIWESMDETAPIILIEPSNVELGNVVVNNPLSVDFTVSQANLSENIALTTNYGVLSVNGETVTTIVAGADPTVVTWSYTPVVENDDFSVQIMAESGDASGSLNISAKVLPAAAQTLHDSKVNFVTHGNASACINLEDVEVIGQSGYYLYLQDAEAGVLVYGAGAPMLSSGDKFVSGYLMGTYEDYHGIIEIKNFQFVDPTTTPGQLTPVSATVDDILANPSNYDSRYVQLNDVNISNWSVAGTSASLAFHDRFQTGYATKTAPATTDLFMVKGLVNGYYANSTTNYQIDPLALTDISTTVKAGAPSFSSSGTATSPSMATMVVITPGNNNTVSYYSINNGEPIPFTTWTYVNLTEASSVITAYGTRDFYANSDNVVSYYQLPANSFTVSFSINGVVNTANNAVVSGQLLEEQTPSVTCFGDFAFAGWSLSESSTETITLPYTINESTILYSVYAKGQEFVYKKVNNVSEFVDGEYVILAEGGHDQFALKNASSTHSPTAYSLTDLGITISNENTLEGGDLSELTWNFNGTSADMTITSTANPTNYLYIIGNSSTGVRVGHTSENTSWTITEDMIVTEQFNMQCNGRYLVVYNDQDWRSYANMNNANSYPRLLIFRKQAVLTNNASRYTRVFWNETASSNIAIIGPSIVPSGYYLDMAESTLTNSSPANLLIEDEASLKVAYDNTDIWATVQKKIVGYVNDTVRTGWHLLSSPVGAFSSTHQHVSGLMVGDFDLYAFDQTKELEWQNEEVEGVDVLFGEQGGVLYANKANTTITFTGELTASVDQLDLVCAPDARLSGWNLIGNPYTSQGYLLTQYFGEGEGTSITDYYKLKDVSENGKKFSKLIATSIDTPVSSMEGVFVQAPSTGYKYWFVNSNRGMVTPDVEFINIKVRDNDGEVMDMARVRFDQGGLLGKFNIGDAGSQLYIPLAGKNYAVVPSQHQGELPLNFKAAENGSYTIGVDLDKAEMNFLHLIDNMTGADIDLLETPDYTFNAKTTDYASRFRLVFSAEGSSDEASSFAYFNGSSWVVIGLETDAILQVIDMTGRIVVSKNAQAGVSANEMSQGVYVLRLISGDTVKTQKIINK